MHLLIFVHVVEYLWKATWCFHAEGDPTAETWVHDKARDVLAGKARTVAATIRRTATNRRLTGTARKDADDAARYLTNKAPYLDYPTALAGGWPIATGVIEGACRFLVADRLDITGARWGLVGAEAVLQLRALRSNGDFDEYWTFHQAQERQRTRNPLRRQRHPPSSMTVTPAEPHPIQNALAWMLTDPTSQTAVTAACEVYRQRRESMAALLAERDVAVSDMDGLAIWVPILSECEAQLVLASHGIAVAGAGESWTKPGPAAIRIATGRPIPDAPAVADVMALAARAR